MTENTKRALPSINEVAGFNPADFTRQLPNEDGTMSLYLDVKYRLLWFRLHNPNGKIETEIVRLDDKSAVVSCKLYTDRADAADQYVAKSCAQRFASTEKYGDRYLETAETAAMGRVLAAAGYGTQFCGAADMIGPDVVDSPLDFSAREDLSDDSGSAASHALHETTSVQSVATNQGSVTQMTPPPPAPVHERKEPVTLEEYMSTMTLEEAKNVMIDVGLYSGSTLGEVAFRKPSDLEWYMKHYKGKNLALKAGATLLVQAAMQQAS